MRRNDSKRDGIDRLRVISGPFEGRVFELQSMVRAVIGRSSACEVTVKDLSVSRRHAELELDSSGRWRVRDMDSRNGISVDGRTGPGWMAIEPGSTVVIGDVRLRYETELDSLEITDPAVVAVEDAALPLVAEARTSSKRRFDDPPSLPDFDPPRPKVSPPAWREGVRTTGVEPDGDAPAPPSYFLGAAIGLGVALALAGSILLVARFGSGSEQDSLGRESTAGATTTAAINALLANGREAAEREQWSQAESAGREVLAMNPEHPQALELLAMAARESRALAEITAAESAFEAGDRPEALLLAEGVHAASRYRQRADDLLDLIEGGGSAQGSDAIARAGTGPETPASQERTTRRPPPRRPPTTRPSPRSPPQRSGPDAIIVEAKRAFADGRVSDARAAAEAAADAGVDGAAGLARQLDAFHRASRSGEAAGGRSEWMVALALYTDAHALAREIAPTNGGAPGAEISSRLADLHYQSARESLAKEDTGAARAHLERALGFQPGHGQARALLDRL